MVAVVIKKFIMRQPPTGKKMIMMVKTPGSQMDSPAEQKKAVVRISTLIEVIQTGSWTGVCKVSR